MKGIILEGIYGSGKSSVMASIKSKINLINSDSALFYSEVFTQRINEHLIGIDPERALIPMRVITRQIKELFELYQTSNFSNDPRQNIFSLSYLYESFHINAAVRYGLSWKSIVDIDDCLSKANCKMIFLKIPEDHIKKRSIVTTIQNRASEWQQYLYDRYQLDDSSSADKLISMQRNMEFLIKKTNIPVLIIDTRDMNWDIMAKKSIDFWQNL